MFDFDALAACLSTSACLVNQMTSGLIIGMLLFLVASGVTLIFGVLNVINFAHGSFYMVPWIKLLSNFPRNRSIIVLNI